MERAVAEPTERRQYGTGEIATLYQVCDSKAGNQETWLASQVPPLACFMGLVKSRLWALVSLPIKLEK